MPILSTIEAKEFLRVSHSSDDAMIDRLILQVEQEAETYTGVNFAGGDASSSSENVTEDLKTALLILLQRLYEGDIKDLATLRLAAEKILFPLRNNLGF